MIACICGGLEIWALLAAISGLSSLVAWLTSKFNKHCCKREKCNDEDW